MGVLKTVGVGNAIAGAVLGAVLAAPLWALLCYLLWTIESVFKGLMPR